jgi:hypothetical protein
MIKADLPRRLPRGIPSFEMHTSTDRFSWFYATLKSQALTMAISTHFLDAAEGGRYTCSFLAWVLKADLPRRLPRGIPSFEMHTSTDRFSWFYATLKSQALTMAISTHFLDAAEGGRYTCSFLAWVLKADLPRRLPRGFISFEMCSLPTDHFRWFYPRFDNSGIEC